jgi:hypothetical protein
MSTSNRGRTIPAAPATPAPRAEAAPGLPPTADSYKSWLDRTQRARARHSAITQNLYSWTNYKNWAERMRTTWVDEKK